MTHTESTLSFTESKVSKFSLRLNSYAKHLKLRFRPIVPSPANAENFFLNFQHSVRSSYYTTLRYDVIHDIFVTCES